MGGTKRFITFRTKRVNVYRPKRVNAYRTKRINTYRTRETNTFGTKVSSNNRNKYGYIGFEFWIVVIFFLFIFSSNKLAPIIAEFIDMFILYKEYFMIFGLGIVLVIGCIIIAIRLIENYNKKKETVITEKVMEFSRKYKKRKDINEKYTFNDWTGDLEFWRRVESVKEFNALEIDDFFEYSIRENYDRVKECYEKALSNKLIYKSYMDEISSIDEMTSTEDAAAAGIKPELFYKIEKRLIETYPLYKPCVECKVYCKITYSSPQGRKHDRKDECYIGDTVKRALEKARLDNQYKSLGDYSQYGPQYERSLMTADLRYRVLKRDGFRCQICGHSQNDGIKLHVDHIMPISKGGRTVMSNLRTLCEACNEGKSDKYDANGLN